jgi:hypothetical protein
MVAGAPSTPSATAAPANGSTSTHQASVAVDAATLPPLPALSGSRSAVVRRQTKETSVEVAIDLDGTGRCTANTPVGFLNHMLDQIASHGLFDLHVNAAGDTWIDDHHTVEDIALALGSALSQALGDRKGIHRFGEFTAPLDEALTHVRMGRACDGACTWGWGLHVRMGHACDGACTWGRGMHVRKEHLPTG